MPSFDIVSELDLQELDNAVNTAIKEVQSRYDFRGSKSEIIWDKKVIVLHGDDDYKMGAMKDILLNKCGKRGIDLGSMDFKEIVPVGGMMMKQTVELKQGIDKETAKKITKSIRDSKLKVQAQIQGEELRITSKSIDTLQECMSYCKEQKFGVPLQFTNMRS